MNVPTSYKQTTLHVCHLAFYQSLRESQHRCYLAGRNKTPNRFRIQFPVKNTIKTYFGKVIKKTVIVDIFHETCLSFFFLLKKYFSCRRVER